MKTPAFVFFDLDGVLVDSEPHHAAAECRIASELSGGRMTDPGFNTTGASTLEVYRVLADKLHLPLDASALAARHFADTFSLLRAAQEPPMPGLLLLLDALDAAQIPYAVVSSSVRSYVENVLHYLGISGRFRFTICSNEVGNVKPAPDPYLKALALSGVIAKDAAVIEDSNTGVRAANAAGIFVIGFDRHVGQDLSIASCRVSALTEIIALFGLHEKTESAK